MPILQIIAIILAVSYVVFFLMFMLSGEKGRSSLPLELRPLLTLGRPFLGILAEFNRRLLFDPDSVRGRTMKRQLEGAGIDPADLSVGDFVGLQEICAVVPVFLLYALLAGLVPDATLICILALGALTGGYYPQFKLLQRMEERKALIFAELPYVVDLLSLAIEAGLDFRRAVERLVEFSEDSPLVTELRYFLHDLDVGLSTEVALKNMAERVRELAFFSFVEAIIQATQMGVDITPTLHAQAEQMRTTYFQRLEREANRTPVLILIPTALCIFPPMLILLLTPAVVKFWGLLQQGM